MSSTANLLQNLPSLASIVDRQPLTVDPDMLLTEVISLMSRAKGRNCLLPDSNLASTSAIPLEQSLRNNIAPHQSAVLVLEHEQLVGIFTERDLVRLTASQRSLQGVKVGEVMTSELQTLVLSDRHTVMSALTIFQQYQIRHLPILNDRQQLIGIVTPEHIRQILQPVNLLKFRSVAEGMVSEVVNTTPTTTILQIAQMMTERNISSIVIVDSLQPLHPVGIITEQDLVQFQTLELNLEQLLVGSVMSSPVFCLQPSDSLWSAQQIMESKQIRRLVITNDRGELAGILTQSNLLQLLDPLEMLCMLEKLQQQTIDRSAELEQSNRELRLEVIRRQQIEDELELRERERTVELNLRTQQLQDEIAKHEFQKYALDRSAIVAMTDRHGVITDVNDQFCQISQYPKDELLGQTHSIINSGYHPPEFFQQLWATIASGQIWRGEIKNRAKDGSYYWVATTIVPFLDDGGRPFQYLAIRFDITEQQAVLRERKQAEESLRDSERKFRAIFDNTFQFVGLVDTDGILIEANRTALEAIGATPADVVGQAFWATPWWTHSPDLQVQLQQAIERAATGELVRFEAKHFLADGSYIIVDFSLSPIFDETGKVVMLIPEGRDITDRKRTEAALQQSERFLSRLISNIPGYIYRVANDPDYTPEFISEGVLAITGYRQAEYMIDRTITCGQEIYPADRDPVWEIVQQALAARQSYECVYRIVTKFGKQKWLWERGRGIYDAEDRLLYLEGFVTDITERKQLEHDRERFLAVASELQLILGSNGYFQWVSPMFESTLGWTTEEMTSAQWTQFVHPDDIAPSVAEETSLFDGNELMAFENRYRHKDGSYRWFSWNAQPDSEKQVIYAVAVDVTDRKAKEQKIQEQAALLDIATDAIVVRDLDNQIQFWNKGAESIYGWQATEAIGQKITELLYADIPLETTLAAQMVREQNTWQGELHKLTKTGKEVIVESRWTLVLDEAGNPRSILSVDTDITEKKQLEQQFLRAQRLESLGSLASGIAHDLNNVLTPIVGAAQLLPMTMPNLDDRNRRLLNMLVESSKRGSGLVKQILTFARGMNGERTTLQVRHILTEIISVARQTFPKSIEIQVNNASEDLWLVSVDATQIHQVLMNLFVNARDAMPDGGSLKASTENIVIDAASVQIQSPVGSYILITIADTGMGMTPEMLDRIFDPFFTTKETGTGLGLSTVRGIVKAHGGAIEVESEVGRGTCFKIYLPAIYSNEAESSSAAAADLYDGKGQLVLVVDDESAIREIAQTALENYNYRVMLASDGIEAIDIYAKNHRSIVIVLVDMMMPNLDTPSIILALQQINPQVQIVVMSGSYLNLETILERQQVSAVLTKPFTTAEMLQTLSEIQIE
jgi:PAS domain S-box-containing protein